MNYDLKTLKSELERVILMKDGVNGIGIVLGDNGKEVLEISVIDKTVENNVRRELLEKGFPEDEIIIVIEAPMQF